MKIMQCGREDTSAEYTLLPKKENVAKNPNPEDDVCTTLKYIENNKYIIY